MVFVQNGGVKYKFSQIDEKSIVEFGPVESAHTYTHSGL